MCAAESSVPPVWSDRMGSKTLSRSVDMAREFVNKLTPVWFSGELPTDALSRVSTLVANHSESYILDMAESAANNFRIPSAAVNQDLSDLVRLGGDIETLIRSRQDMHRSDRFNEERCRTWFAADIELNTLLDIARFGAVIDVDSDFVPSNRPDLPRPLLRRLSHTFSHHAFELWSKKQAILLPLSVAVKCNLHFSPLHWTPKPGKPLGRFLCDLSNAQSGCVLNNPAAKALIDARYGAVALPTIGDIVDAIYDMANQSGGLSNVLLWKEDIVSAFNQFSFNPKSAKWLAFQVEDNVVIILFTGVFGWQGSPAVWAVFSRALLRASIDCVHGHVIVYVDDFIGVSGVLWASFDQPALRELIIGVFGEDAINIDKSILPCRVCDCIGWTVDLDNEVIYPNEKGRNKLVSAFFGVDLTKILSIKVLQRLGSLSSRYSVALIGLRPFVNPFFQCISEGRDRHATSEVRACVLVWRAVALVLMSNPVSLAVPLLYVSSRMRPVDFIVTSDAGPLGLGVVVRSAAGNILSYASYRLPFDVFNFDGPTARESKFQNVREFLGVILGMLLCKQLCRITCTIQWINDNTAALSWVRDNMARSRAAQMSFLAYTWVNMLGHIDVEQVFHIPGVTMGDVDSLSRFLPTLSLEEHLNWSERLPVHLLDCFFLSCDPTSAGQAHLIPWDEVVCNTILLVEQCLKMWDIPNG